MQVEIKTPMADAMGRAFRPGRRYEMAEDEAVRLIKAGFATEVASDASLAVDLLAKLGGGLVVTRATDQALVVAAKARRLLIKRQRGAVEGGDGGGGD